MFLSIMIPTYNGEKYIAECLDSCLNQDISVDNNLAGMVGYYANDYELKKAYLSIIVIRKEYQGYGIGSKLLQMFIEESKSKGMNVCRLEVGCYNEKAISFYLKKRI